MATYPDSRAHLTHQCSQEPDHNDPDVEYTGHWNIGTPVPDRLAKLKIEMTYFTRTYIAHKHIVSFRLRLKVLPRYET